MEEQLIVQGVKFTADDGGGIPPTDMSAEVREALAANFLLQKRNLDLVAANAALVVENERMKEEREELDKSHTGLFQNFQAAQSRIGELEKQVRELSEQRETHTRFLSDAAGVNGRLYTAMEILGRMPYDGLVWSMSILGYLRWVRNPDLDEMPRYELKDVSDQTVTRKTQGLVRLALDVNSRHPAQKPYTRREVIRIIKAFSR